ncbi:MAG: cation-translocating P-type ATPase [Armatimonadota bacterium]|nr:cadmium-translocating P-type ATPase [bacterium]
METQTLDIPVIWPNYYEDCGQCTQRLQEALAEMDGVQNVSVDTDRKTVRLTYQKDLVTFEEISDRATALGVTIAERYVHEKLRLVGLDCPNCAIKLETAIRKVNGVAWASLNYATSALIVEFQPDTVRLSDIIKRIREFGYNIEEEIPGAPPSAKAKILRSAHLTLTIVSGALLAAGLALHLGNVGLQIIPMLFIAAAITGGIYPARTGILSAKSFVLDTNFLVTAAALGAIALGDFSEAAAVMFLFSLGSTLEAYTVDKTRRSIKSLIEDSPTHASVKRDGHVDRLPLEEIEIGDIVIIKPGDKLPVDGTVIDGESTVNESPITGESMPVAKARGNVVYAGSINGRGALEVRTTTRCDDNTLSRIVHLVEEAQAQKAPSQRFSETFGRIYTPVIIALAVVVGIGGTLVIGGDYRSWVTRALTLLIVSCPCALVISTPVAIVAAIGNAARSGVLIKGGAHLEMLGDVSIVAFDKTGTLTLGKPVVTDIIPANSRTSDDLLSIAAAIESRSEHPIADAIVDKARELDLPERPVSFFEAYPGKGARAVVNGGLYYAGNKRLMGELGIALPDAGPIAELTALGNTMVYVCDESALVGAIAASDRVKDSSAPAITQLKQTGIKRTVMLTGDNAQTAALVANYLGIDKTYAELLPEDKLAKIRQLGAKHNRVAMVGDGINDAPALAAADVGIAMGGAGSHTAIEAADVALMADDITMLPYAVALSRKSRSIIRQNVAIALGIIVILITGALLQRVNLATGVLGHEGSALLVIANSMRLLKRNGSS